MQRPCNATLDDSFRANSVGDAKVCRAASAQSEPLQGTGYQRLCVADVAGRNGQGDRKVHESPVHNRGALARKISRHVQMRETLGRSLV